MDKRDFLDELETKERTRTTPKLAIRPPSKESEKTRVRVVTDDKLNEAIEECGKDMSMSEKQRHACFREHLEE